MALALSLLLYSAALFVLLPPKWLWAIAFGAIWLLGLWARIPNLFVVGLYGLAALAMFSPFPSGLIALGLGLIAWDLGTFSLWWGKNAAIRPCWACLRVLGPATGLVILGMVSAWLFASLRLSLPFGILVFLGVFLWAVLGWVTRAIGLRRSKEKKGPALAQGKSAHYH
ncbi:MAG: hypothetical protein ACPLRP_00445 [Candidatus Bipolaricaulaceae bacterium]